MKNVESFSETPVTSWLVTDSDGTVVPHDSNADITVPSKDFLEKVRQYSFDNPNFGIMILSGRKDNELTTFYKDAFEPSPDGKIPKIVLAPENGAYLRLSTKPKELLKQSDPLSDSMKKTIALAISKHSKEYYTETNENMDLNKISVRLEMKTFGCTCHFRTPNNPNDIETLGKIKLGIRDEFLELQNQNSDLHIDFDAASAFTLELVSKGVTLQKIATGSLSATFNENNFHVGTPQFMSYTGDDKGDWASIRVLNTKLNKKELEGYTARPCNHSPTTDDVATRVSNSPKQNGGQEDFYILGTSHLTAQEIHRDILISKEETTKLSSLRKELAQFSLLSSLHKDVPPVVLLETDLLLIQEPEKYTPDVLDNLASWKASQLIIVANGESILNQLTELSKKNKNIAVVTRDGLLVKEGVVNNDFSPLFEKGMEQNKIVSGNSDYSVDIQLLRAFKTSYSMLLNQKEMKPLTKPKTGLIVLTSDNLDGNLNAGVLKNIKQREQLKELVIAIPTDPIETITKRSIQFRDSPFVSSILPYTYPHELSNAILAERSNVIFLDKEKTETELVDLLGEPGKEKIESYKIEMKAIPDYANKTKQEDIDKAETETRIHIEGLRKSKKTGITFSTFELLHAGHQEMFKEAKEQCDYLIAAVQVDPSIDRPEKNSPTQSFLERVIQARSSKYVDAVAFYNLEAQVTELLQLEKPDIRILGDEYKDKQFSGRAYCEEHNIQCYFNERRHDFSSSGLRKHIAAAEKAKIKTQEQGSQTRELDFKNFSKARISQESASTGKGLRKRRSQSAPHSGVKQRRT